MPDNDNNVSVNDLGAMSPEKALEYMKKTENLVIVDVATRSWYAKEHFEGAINIPIENISPDEAEKLYLDIPAGRPVILHCRLGMVVPGAYRTLKNCVRTFRKSPISTGLRCSANTMNGNRNKIETIAS